MDDLRDASATPGCRFGPSRPWDDDLDTLGYFEAIAPGLLPHTGSDAMPGSPIDSRQARAYVDWLMDELTQQDQEPGR